MSIKTSFPEPVEEVIHGVTVRDPYRWLEDRNLGETEQWIRAQQIRCDRYFSECGDLKEIRDHVRKYLDVDVVDQPAKIAGQYFYRRRNRGREQGGIYVLDGARGIERLLVDPLFFGAFASVGIHRISSDGSLLAFEVREGGDDKKAIHIVDVETGTSFPYGIETGYSRGFAFRSDMGGCYHCQETSPPTEDHTIRLSLFQDPAVDQVVFRTARSEGSRLFLIADHVHLGAVWMHEESGRSVCDVWVARQKEPENWQCLFSDVGIPFCPIFHAGRIFVLTQTVAPNGKVIELGEDGQETRIVVPEQNTPIGQVVIAGDNIFVSYLDRMIPSIRSWNLSGEEREGIDIPIDGTVRLLPNQGGEDTVFYEYESFTQSPIIFEHHPDCGRSVIWHRRLSHFDQQSVTVQETKFESSDCTEIPITIVRKSRQDAGQPSPLIMTSYGGFGVSSTPQFSILVTIMMDLGADFALPHIRGGGEFGKAWHEAGRQRNRETSFGDFIAAAEWLCREGFTSPSQLAIFGGSNSGLLVGAAMTRRPELFRAVLCIAPLLDMVRYEHFDRAARWRQEYGTVENEDDFRVLHICSPYHRVKEDVDYPSALFVTGDKDERCNPAHVRKMAARLLDRPAQQHPILVDYSGQRGHFPALPLSFRVEALVRRIAFLWRELNLPISEGRTHEALGY